MGDRKRDDGLVFLLIVAGVIIVGLLMNMNGGDPRVPDYCTTMDYRTGAC